MNDSVDPTRLRITLRLSAPDQARLRRLQEAFSRGCNFLAPIARAHRCWSRVALHHLGYKALREAHPELGAQMTCNAVYAVCRACLAIYMNPAQPWCPKARQPLPLPDIVFSTRAPVYFDRHTLAIRKRAASIFTLEGRLHCALETDDALLARLQAEHVVQTLLMSGDDGFSLDFQFDGGTPARPRNGPRALVPSESTLALQLQIDPPPALAPIGAAHLPQPPLPNGGRPPSAS